MDWEHITSWTLLIPDKNNSWEPSIPMVSMEDRSDFSGYIQYVYQNREKAIAGAELITLFYKSEGSIGVAPIPYAKGQNNGLERHRNDP